MSWDYFIPSPFRKTMQMIIIIIIIIDSHHPWFSHLNFSVANLVLRASILPFPSPGKGKKRDPGKEVVM